MVPPDWKNELNIGLADRRAAHVAEPDHFDYALLVATVVVAAVLLALPRLL